MAGFFFLSFRSSILSCFQVSTISSTWRFLLSKQKKKKKKERNLFSGVLDCAQYGHQDRTGKQHTSSGVEGSAAPPSQMACDCLPSWPLAGFLYVSFCLCSVSHDHLLYVHLCLLHLCTISLIELKDPAITACLLISFPV